jgi:hypothetical protein
MASSNEWKVKIVGRRLGYDATSRETEAYWKTADEWLRTIHKLRGGAGVCPRGVYRFKTFEEAEQWKIKMLARSSLAAQHSKT